MKNKCGFIYANPPWLTNVVPSTLDILLFWDVWELLKEALLTILATMYQPINMTGFLHLMRKLKMPSICWSESKLPPCDNGESPLVCSAHLVNSAVWWRWLLPNISSGHILWAGTSSPLLVHQQWPACHISPHPPHLPITRSPVASPPHYQWPAWLPYLSAGHNIGTLGENATTGFRTPSISAGLVLAQIVALPLVTL